MGSSSEVLTANRALELLGRHLGMFKDAGVHINLSTDQSSFRERMAAKRRQRASGKLRLVTTDPTSSA